MNISKLAWLGRGASASWWQLLCANRMAALLLVLAGLLPVATASAQAVTFAGVSPAQFSSAGQTLTFPCR